MPELPTPPPGVRLPENERGVYPKCDASAKEHHKSVPTALGSNRQQGLDVEPSPKPRGSRPDFEAEGNMVLVKRVSHLRATYQIRLLAYFAMKQNRRLVVKVPNQCVIHESLTKLANELPGRLLIVRSA